MKYDAEKAREIIGRHNLSRNTMKVWKYRDEIPGRYQDEQYDNSGPVALKDTIRLVEITQLPEICPAHFASVKYRKIVDVKRYHTKGKRASQHFTAAEVTAFKSEITRLRNKLRAFTQAGGEKELRAVITDARIKHYVLFQKQKRMLGRLYRRLEAYDYELQECRLDVARLYNLLKW